MDSLDKGTHVFIVRVWIETREIEGAEALWRAVVEHVSSGQRRYLENLGEIETVIVQHLRDMG